MAINYLNSIDLNKNELLQGVIENQPNDAAAGSSPVTGQIYYNTTDFELRQYNGTAWVSVGDITSLTPGTNISITNPASSSPTINVIDNPTFAGNVTISKVTPKLIITDTAASNCTLEISQQGSNTSFTSRGGTSSTGQFNFRITNGSTTTNALFINQQARATFAGDVVINGGDITLGGTGRIQGVDTVTDGTDATNKTYVDNAIAGVPQGDITGIDAGTYISITDPNTATPTVNALGTATPYVAATDDSKLVARDANGYGYVKTPASGDSTTKIATTAFVQSSLTGLLEFKGGFNANTGAIVGGGNLTSGGTRVAVAVGDYYVVTVDGDFFGNAATPLTVGDSVIVQTAAAAGASVEGDFIVVQSDTDLATATTVGLGNVVPGASNTITAPYSNGTATLDVVDSTAAQKGAVIVSAGTGISVAYVAGEATVTNTETNSDNSFSGTIGDGSLTSLPITAATHGLGSVSSSFMIQLVEVSSGETVYADVTRGASGLVTIDFAVAPATNAIRVLIQKIG